MKKKIIDMLKCLTFHGEESPEHVEFYAQEILALKYQIARELYKEWETTLVVDGDGNVLEGLSFTDWLDQRENDGKPS